MRTSADVENERGRLIEGYDYNNQAWVVNGRYVDCSHVYKHCGCYGRLHKGEETK